MLESYWPNMGLATLAALVSGSGMFPGTTLGHVVQVAALVVAIVFFLRALASFAD